MGKTQPVTAVGEKLDPYHLPGSVAFWMRLSERHDGVVLMPRVLPDTYEKSIGLLVRLGVAAYNPDSFDDPVFVPATDDEVSRFRGKEYTAELDAAEKGQPYANRYEAIMHLAEVALSQGMPEPELKLATVIPISALGQSNIPGPRQPIDPTPGRLATA